MRPAITFAASLASGTPMALETKGVVRDARGLTSSTWTVSSFTANCTFIRPLTFSSRASALVASVMAALTFSDSENGGITHALSPEWMPACSMCSMIAPSTTVSPSERQSTSTSVASSRKRSTRMGRSGLTAMALRM